MTAVASMFADDLYSSGGSTIIPEGDYALELTAQMYQAEKKTGEKVGKARLVVMVTAYPINRETGELTGEPIQKPYGLGTRAHESFQPDPDTGKTLIPVPGAPYQTLMGNTNWALLRKSLVDCDPTVATLPDFSAIDGIWVHMQNVPEPEERKNFTAKTASAEDEEEKRQGPGVVGIVTEIIAKPWENEGGIPTVEAAPAPVKKTAAKAPVKTAAAPVKAPVKPAVKPPVQKAAAAPAAAADDDDMRVLAVSLISAQLENNITGMKRLKLRTEVFKAAGDNANGVISTAFKDDDTLNGILNGLGYQISGGDIVQQG